MGTPAIVIDPNTGERIDNAAQVQIDPATGERVTSVTSQPSGLDALKANISQLMAPSPDSESGFERFAHGFARAGANVLAHPLDTAAGLLQGAANPYAAATAAPAAMAIQYGGSPHPVIDMAADQAGSGAMLGPLAEIAGKGIAKAPDNAAAVSDLADRAKQYVRPTSSPSIVPRTEMAARQLSAAVLPATKDATNFIQAAAQEVPNVIDYAKRTGNPLNTQLEFSKAAQGYAQDVRNFYTNDVLGPSQDKLVKTNGTGFGQRMGESPDTYATLGEIDKRIIDVNKQLDAPSLNADDARRALASKTGLQQEASGLRDILHKNLAQSTGLAPDQIADIRQRVGRSYELANDTDAAVTQRMQAEGKSELKPVTATQVPSIVFNKYLRGGTVSIADRAFQSAIKQFPGQAQPLPTIPQP
jgi:hypothetical protein